MTPRLPTASRCVGNSHWARGAFGSGARRGVVAFAVIGLTAGSVVYLGHRGAPIASVGSPASGGVPAGTTAPAGPNGVTASSPGTTSTAVSTASTTTVVTPATRAPVGLVPWTGTVEHLFFHTLIIRPDLAFHPNDSTARGFRNYFVTVTEFKAILVQLYANGWTLVDIHRAVAGTVEVPRGRKPFVLSEDDVNYFDYERPRGLGRRLVLDGTGAVKVEVRDNRGTRVTDDDLVPLVDEFVVRHPEFSADGAKGILASTGYEGILGERVNTVDDPEVGAARQRARAVAARLRATGWSFANHSYGHNDMTRRTLSQLRRDTDRWKAEGEPILGSTDVYIYPFGATTGPGSPPVAQLRDAGYTIQCDIGPAPRLVHVAGTWIMSRRHIDGIAFRSQARNLASLFDVATVEDLSARGS